MSMKLSCPVNKLSVCPECGSRRLVVARYGRDEDEFGYEHYLECEGCCSVVAGLGSRQLLSLKKTPEGRTILARELMR
jgi:hypothetical protein